MPSFYSTAAVAELTVVSGRDQVTAELYSEQYPIFLTLGDAEYEDEDDWDQLNREALSGEEIDAIADYLRSTGQASA
ncbi:MAG: hypothetical protein WD847_19480 [Pirellulales bacterium]